MSTEFARIVLCLRSRALVRAFASPVIAQTVSLITEARQDFDIIIMNAFFYGIMKPLKQPSGSGIHPSPK